MPKVLTITSDAPGERVCLLGNEAIARGAIEAGVQVAAAYPGTPSTEIVGTLSEVAKDVDMYVEWSTNEKVAFEVPLAASMSGLRGLSCMKQLGVNVALDSLKAASFKGTEGGLVMVAVDEPMIRGGMQEWQDTRYLAQRSYVPILEPASVQEAKDMMVDAFRLSEQFKHPFMLRSVTRLSHARSNIVLGEISREKRQGFFIKKPSALGDELKDIAKTAMFERYKRIKEAVNTLPYNQLKLASGARLGIIASGLSYSYTLDAIRELGLEDRVSILKIGTPYPLPEQLVKRLLSSVEEVLVVEELDSFVELLVKAITGEANLAVKIHGKDLIPMGESPPRLIIEAIAQLTGARSPIDYARLDKLAKEVAPLLPSRPPLLCAGCPHRASQFAITRAARRVAKDYGDGVEPVYPGDIGCYNLATNPPLNAVDQNTVCSMGSSFGIASGLAHTIKAPVVAHLGDSTFFHAGIPPLINTVFNKAKVTMIVLDNSTTAMTGFQPHPGTGSTAMGEETVTMKPEDIARACGVKFIEVLDPFDDLKKTVDTLERAMRFEGPSFVVFRRLCAQIELREKRRRGEEVIPYQIDQAKCHEKCSTCIKLFGCPAIIVEDGKKTIDSLQCTGCGVCAQICPYRAIVLEQKKP